MSESDDELVGTAGAEGTGSGRALGATAAQRLADTLPPEQQLALSRLSSGEPIKAAAEAAGVTRGTVYRWIRFNAHFRAAYNAWQQEQLESCRAVFFGCAAEAAREIAKGIRMNDRLAFQLLKELGVFNRPRATSVDPEVVQREISVERLQKEAHLDQRELRHLLEKGGTPPRLARRIASGASEAQKRSTDTAQARGALSRRAITRYETQMASRHGTAHGTSNISAQQMIHSGLRASRCQGGNGHIP